MSKVSQDGKKQEQGVVKTMHDLKDGINSTFATAWHDAWFRKQVDLGLKEADAQAADCVTNETVQLERAQWRAELQKLKTPIT